MDSTGEKPRIPLEQSDVAHLGIGDLESEKDEERLVKFLEILSEKVNEYTPPGTICEIYKKLFNTSHKIGYHRFIGVVDTIQGIEEIDLETRAKIMFIVGTRLGLDFIKSLHKLGTVAIGLLDMIIFFQSNKADGKTFGEKPPDCSGFHANRKKELDILLDHRRAYSEEIYQRRSTLKMNSMLSVADFLRYFSLMIRLLKNPDLKELEKMVKEKRAQTSGAADKKTPVQDMIATIKVNITLISKHVESASKNGQDLQIFVEHFSDFLCLLTSKNTEFREIQDLLDRTFMESDDNQSKQIPLNILKIAFESMFFDIGQ